MEQFRLEVDRNGQGYFFDIHSLGNNRYDILKEDVLVGTLQLDDKDHQHCETINCEIDLPLMNSIREGILLHEDVSY
ncbi:hypothetical protein [Pedobacter sp. JCM 36344]|uniref:hypothetical protein n=1 Tax=Pedobacter sp. JCM 36344 TaxID=3374280 RepID=UPI003978ABB9